LHVLIDADALPRAVKDIVFRAARRVEVKWTMVANKRLYVPPELKIGFVTVERNPDEADDSIVGLVGEGDLVITSDIPLADRVIAKKAAALSPKGDFFTEANIKARLATRNLLDQLRNEGEIKCGGAPYDVKDAQAFSNQLDRYLTKRLREEAASKRPAPKGFAPPEG